MLKPNNYTVFTIGTEDAPVYVAARQGNPTAAVRVMYKQACNEKQFFYRSPIAKWLRETNGPITMRVVGTFAHRDEAIALKRELIERLPDLFNTTSNPHPIIKVAP